MTNFAIGQYLAADQKAAIMDHVYWLDAGYLVTADDTRNRCALAVAAGVIWTPRESELSRMLGIPEPVVRQFVAAADHGKITSREELAAAIGATS